MEQITTLNKQRNIYWENLSESFNLLNITDLNNRLFCTFTTLDGIDPLVESITNSYTIMYNKMFVLYIKSTDEYVVTYNVEQGNVSDPGESREIKSQKESEEITCL